MSDYSHLTIKSFGGMQVWACSTCGIPVTIVRNRWTWGCDCHRVEFQRREIVKEISLEDMVRHAISEHRKHVDCGGDCFCIDMERVLEEYKLRE